MSLGMKWNIGLASGVGHHSSFNGHSLRSGRMKRAWELGRFAMADGVGEAEISNQ